MLTTDFFASRNNAYRWLSKHPDINGEAISMEEAILAGRAVFGHVLEQG